MKESFRKERQPPPVRPWGDPMPSKTSSPRHSRLSYLVNSTSMIPSVMTLRVGVHYTRVILGTLAALTFVSSIVLVFHHGVEMEEITVQQDARDYVYEGKLIDDYNSYSGTVVSAFGRPLELFIELVVQLFVLRFASSSILRPETPWHTRCGVVCSAAALAYLVNNGFNALNAQLRPLDIRPVISAADLSVAMNTNDSWNTDEITNISHVVSEATPGNPISNTVLRNLVLPRIWTKYRRCKLSVSTEPLPLDTADYGFPARPWHRQMLPNALTAETVEVPVDNMTTINEALARKLPMNASLASNLFLHGALMASRYYFPWFPSIFTNLLDTIGKKYSTASANTSRIDEISQLLNLAPKDNDSDNDEIPSRLFFLKASREMMQTQLSGSNNSSEKPLKLKFSHVNISPTIHFDAVTFEVELSKTNPPDRTFRCGPSSDMCMFERPEYGDIVGELDPPAQINAFALCLNQIDDDEAIYVRSTANKDWSIDCSQISNSSLLVVSVGKRIVADKAKGEFEKESSSNKSYEFEVHNLRKIYSFTVGRLEWKLEDLSNTFSARCNVEDGAKCVGLHHLLSEKTSRLVVSADELPMGLLAPFSFEDNAIQRILALVRIQEPSASAMTTTSGMYEVASGDILFPHNVGSMTSDTSVNLDGSLCARWVEDRLHSVLNNHFYIEHTLQPAYTAAMLFLFQDATTKDVLTLSKDRESLKFSQNIQRMAVRLSIPPINMILSLIGCVLCGFGVIGALLYPIFTTRDPLEDIDSAHVIAQVMLDESKFPPLILRRHLVDLLDDRSKRSEVEAFVIQALALSPQEYPNGNTRIHFGAGQRETRDSSNSLVVDLE